MDGWMEDWQQANPGLLKLESGC